MDFPYKNEGEFNFGEKEFEKFYKVISLEKKILWELLVKWSGTKFSSDFHTIFLEGNYLWDEPRSNLKGTALSFFQGKSLVKFFKFFFTKNRTHL